MSNLYPTNQMNLINYDTERFYYITTETVSDDNLVLNKSLTFLLAATAYWKCCFINGSRLLSRISESSLMRLFFQTHYLWLLIRPDKPTPPAFWLTKNQPVKSWQHAFFVLCENNGVIIWKYHWKTVICPPGSPICLSLISTNTFICHIDEKTYLPLSLNNNIE